MKKKGGGSEAVPIDEEAIVMVTPCKEGEVYNQNTGELYEKDKSMALTLDTTGYGRNPTAIYG